MNLPLMPAVAKKKTQSHVDEALSAVVGPTDILISIILMITASKAMHPRQIL